MNDKPIKTPLILENSVKASSSLQSAFRSVYNTYIIVCQILISVVWLFLLFFSDYDIPLMFIVIGGLNIILLPIEIWRILTRSLEISNDGVRYEEAWKKVFLRWDEIEAIKIGNFWKEIVFWVNGKKTRINVYGLKADEFSVVNRTLLTQVELHKIMVK